MSKADDGGPAFPDPLRADPASAIPASSGLGMSLRDYFAGQALTGLISMVTDCTPSEHAADAYQFADAMIAARKA